MDTETLRRSMVEAFAVAGATTPSWPDPHPDGQSPLQEEYSRCLNPGKYRILGARLDAWVQTLTELGLGATPALGGQGDVPWTCLADPEGHEFCVLALSCRAGVEAARFAQGRHRELVIRADPRRSPVPVSGLTEESEQESDDVGRADHHEGQCGRG